MGAIQPSGGPDGKRRPGADVVPRILGIVTTEAIVQAAIHQRRALLFSYEGDGLPERVGHPHAIFLGADRVASVDIYQVAGFTRTATLPAWRTFLLDRIVTAERLEEQPFELAPGWDPLGDKYAGGIVAMV
jgi:predicted DNA-binding transcriptional regulator YafY